MKVEEFINILKKLQTIGVDVSKLVAKDTIETLAKKSGINREKLEEIGLDSTLKMGNKKTTIAQAYRGQGTSKPPTKEQVEELVKLGVSLEKQEHTVQEFINILKKLQTIGVDVSKLVARDTIETLAGKSGISSEKLEKTGLDPTQRIGNKKTTIVQAYRGKGEGKRPTKKQVEELAKLGISLERKRITGKKIVEASIISLTKQKMKTEEFINILKTLQTIGVDVSRMTARNKIEKLAEKSGISREKVEEIGLDPAEKIGRKKDTIGQVYRGKRKGKCPTKEQVEEIAKLGISLQERDTVQEFVDTIAVLQTIGVDISKVSISDTIETLAKKSGISREKLEEIGVDPEKKIGIQKSNIAQAYRGKGTCKSPTKEQVEELAKLGISLERKRITGKKIVEASIISLTNQEMADTEDAALKALVEQREQKLR